MTGVYQATARRGAAALGNPSAAAAPGAGHVTGNAPRRSCCAVLGPAHLPRPGLCTAALSTVGWLPGANADVLCGQTALGTFRGGFYLLLPVNS